MLCDVCAEREATIHEVLIEGGVKKERHLCEHCAAEAGVQTAGHSPLPSLIAQAAGVVLGQVAEEASSSRGSPSPCPSCGLTYAAFRKTGLLGCPTCYDAFEPALGPLIERAHEGGTCHTGKRPAAKLKRLEQAGGAETITGDEESAAARIATLRRQLERAVVAEQYELAARLRDELMRLTGGMGGGVGGGAS